MFQVDLLLMPTVLSLEILNLRLFFYLDIQILRCGNVLLIKSVNMTKKIFLKKHEVLE